MSKYTVELKTICENLAGVSGIQLYSNIENTIDISWKQIFDFDFPIFDESYREILCKKIIRHYYFYEIGMETVGNWQHYLHTKMVEIMPKYNKLYELEARGLSLYDNINMSREYVRNNAGDSVSRNLYSDTPQGALTNVDNETYLTSANKNIGNATNNEQYTETTKGHNGKYTYLEFVKQYSRANTDTDMMIISELSDLFMNLW